jgi:hypothetical protein
MFSQQMILNALNLMLQRKLVSSFDIASHTPNDRKFCFHLPDEVYEEL